MAGVLGQVLGVEGLAEGLALCRVHPVGLLGAVGEVEVGPDADGDREEPLSHEHPLGASKACEAVELEQAPRQRVADDAGHWRRDACV